MLSHSERSNDNSYVWEKRTNYVCMISQPLATPMGQIYQNLKYMYCGRKCSKQALVFYFPVVHSDTVLFFLFLLFLATSAFHIFLIQILLFHISSFRCFIVITIGAFIVIIIIDELTAMKWCIAKEALKRILNGRDNIVNTIKNR